MVHCGVACPQSSAPLSSRPPSAEMQQGGRRRAGSQRNIDRSTPSLGPIKASRGPELALLCSAQQDVCVRGNIFTLRCSSETHGTAPGGSELPHLT
ncbi:hypothetical protein AAFF_G00106420 [Aldrovandia affinis]|uniref:Uncharacterized protein n=1 Tax=Aldrovandia affinis TaxID=143900 RepID=A0AAD7T298_9TELE|nr:hypothetical protein AAFF_G00106420 [Aldrovandia affinis]